jgi:hypothetical protein
MRRGLFFAVLLALAPAVSAFYKRIYMDLVALQARSTTRHIMRPLTEEGRQDCLRLKQALREEASGGRFVVDAFVAAAASESLDDESRELGGLIGRRLRQGVCREPELDKACFCSPIGQVAGPFRTGEGYHLVLVEERLGLQRQDNGMTRVVAKPRETGGGMRSVLAPPDPDEASELLAPSALLSLMLFVIATIAGGQLIAELASSVDIEQIANSME